MGAGHTDTLATRCIGAVIPRATSSRQTAPCLRPGRNRPPGQALGRARSCGQGSRGVSSGARGLCRQQPRSICERHIRHCTVDMIEVAACGFRQPLGPIRADGIVCKLNWRRVLSHCASERERRPPATTDQPGISTKGRQIRLCGKGPQEFAEFDRLATPPVRVARFGSVSCVPCYCLWPRGIRPTAASPKSLRCFGPQIRPVLLDRRSA
jgi:hypothetical protein